MFPSDFRSPLRSLTDVPVERGRVGGMNLGAAPSHHAQFRPYFYRGTGEDTMEARLQAEERDAERKRMEEEQRAERRAARLLAEARRREESRRLAREREAERKRVSEKAAALQAEYDALPLAKVIPLFPQGPPPVEVSEPQIPARPTQPPRKPRWVDHRPKGPSPGWKPLSGADLDGLLDD